MTNPYEYPDLADDEYLYVDETEFEYQARLVELCEMVLDTERGRAILREGGWSLELGGPDSPCLVCSKCGARRPVGLTWYGELPYDLFFACSCKADLR